MDNVDVKNSLSSDVQKSRKEKKGKKTAKNQDLADHGSEITIAEIEQTSFSEDDKRYVYMCD